MTFGHGHRILVLNEDCKLRIFKKPDENPQEQNAALQTSTKQNGGSEIMQNRC